MPCIGSVKVRHESIDQRQDNTPSSTGAGVGSFDLSSLGFAFAFAKDLKMSPAVLSFFAPDFESDLFKVLAVAAGWVIDALGVLASDALPLREGNESSFFG
jgi:hypothetical protein